MPYTELSSFLESNSGTRFSGQSELWLDPLGNTVELSACTLKIGVDRIEYTWVYENEEQSGILVIGENSIHWKDTWHQEDRVECKFLENTWGIFDVEYSYPAPPGPDWGWRIKLSQRPDQSIILQMTNIAPWGEEGRAVRMTFS